MKFLTKSSLSFLLLSIFSHQIRCFGVRKTRPASKRSLSMNQDFLNILGEEITKSLGTSYKPTSWSRGGGGGGGASVGIISDDSKKEFFVKKGNLQDFNMLNAEYQGIKEMYDTHTIKVPQPICIGTSDYDSFVVFEKLSMGGFGKPELMAEKLAAMHRCTSPNGMYGFKIDNTCGATFQPNTFTETWSEFWDVHRLGHMLTLAERDGAYFRKKAELRKKVREILDAHECVPSLVHGDLWSGNQAYTSKGEPVIFDPATYYGDREVDLAMTKLFGSNSKSFYDTYNNIWPLPEGWKLRETVYNLYHILNHYVLFGGGYLSQANGMIERILSA